MKRILFAVVLSIIISISTVYAGSESVTIQSYTLKTFKQLIDGIDNEKETEITAKLTIPKNTEGKIPAMVFMHGAGGISKKHDFWVKTLSDMGIAILQIDSFKPRKVKQVVANYRQISTSTMVVDAYQGLKFLAEHPRIDKNRIGIMGSSKGGTVSIASLYNPVKTAMKTSGLKFAVHIPLYPACLQFEEYNLTGSPLLVLCGKKDDWVGVGACDDLVEDLKGVNYPVEYVVFPGAYHNFDAHYKQGKAKNTSSLENCRFLIEKDGRTMSASCNVEAGNKGYVSCCVKKKTLYNGENKAAKNGAKKKIQEILTELFF